MRPLPDPASRRTAIGDFLAENPHAYTRDELVDAWSRRQLDRGIREGTVARLATGVYCGATRTSDLTVRGEALNLWQPTGAVTGAGALHLYDESLPKPERLDLLVPHGRRLEVPPWARLRQTGPIRSTTRANGVACVPMARALLDAWRYAPAADRRDILWEALWARVCTWRQLRRELDRAARVAGRRDLERVLSWFGSGATTPLEVRAKHETFADARFREFEWQAPLALPSRRAVPDMLHRRAMLAVELDGDRVHATREARDRDRTRRTDLAAAGYAVVGFGWNDITRRPAWCRERLLAVLASRLSAQRGS
ncbi:DUF559 domain-containing protein [Demequina rhizosphaerae]|uniref:DUF559 domain-containing protein n=1 Tax=Demequina rhizosphaerae TaxID=1638985 RepID=UPI00078030CA|nr:DUF559 domain-containing protein [Demequina rhizosphaerae]